VVLLQADAVEVVVAAAGEVAAVVEAEEAVDVAVVVVEDAAGASKCEAGELKTAQKTKIPTCKLD
jgi:hypothetical protein